MLQLGRMAPVSPALFLSLALCGCDRGETVATISPPATAASSVGEARDPNAPPASPSKEAGDRRAASLNATDAEDEPERMERFMDPFDVKLFGLLVGNDEAWQLVVADDRRELDDMLVVGTGRGPHARLKSSLAAEDALSVPRTLVVLGADGGFFGEASAGSELLLERTLTIRVFATGALDVVALRPSGDCDSGWIEVAIGPSSEDDWYDLDHAGVQVRVTRPALPSTETLLDQRLRLAKWLPFGEYRVALESPLLEAKTVHARIDSRGKRRVEVRMSLRGDLVRLVVRVRSTTGSEHTDFPVLEISDGPGRELFQAPDDPGVIECGPSLYHYSALGEWPDDDWGFEIPQRQPETLSISATHAGELTERRDPVRDGVLRVYLEWTPAPEAVEPR